MRVLVGGIGYRNLRDHSFGIHVIEALCGGGPGELEPGPGQPGTDSAPTAPRVPDDVSIEDLSYGPIAVVQRLDDEPPERRFTRVVLVGAVERSGRKPGTLTVYRWNAVLPDPGTVQTAVAEAVTGVIALENTVIVAGHFGALPPEIVIVELQPEVEESGDGLSESGARALRAACPIVTRAATDATYLAELPTRPLGGGPPLPARSFNPRVSDGANRAR